MLSSFFKHSSVLEANAASTNKVVSGTGANNGSSFDELAVSDGKLEQLTAQKVKPAHELAGRENALNYKIFDPEDLIRKLDIKPNFKIADFGCGAGNIVLPLAKNVGPNVEIYGVDVQKDLLIKMLRQAKADKLKNVFAVWGDLDELGGSKLPDAQFDLVLIVNMLFQLEDKKAALQEAFRVLKPGAHLCIVDWLDSGLTLGPRKDNLVDKSSLLQMAEEAGLLFSEESKLGDHHFKLDFNKKIL